MLAVSPIMPIDEGRPGIGLTVLIVSGFADALKLLPEMTMTRKVNRNMYNIFWNELIEINFNKFTTPAVYLKLKRYLYRR